MNEKLKQLIQLRRKLNQLQNQIDEIMPDAITEALNIAQAESSINGKGIVYQDKTSRIVLGFRKRFPSPKDNITLERLDADIKAEKHKLAVQNKLEISDIEIEVEALNKTISQLENKRESLLTSQQLIKLKARYSVEREQGCYLIPNLSVFLNK